MSLQKPESTFPASNDTSTPSHSRAGSFFDGFARFLIALFPYALGIGVITIKLPEWALMLTQLWGPGFVILGLFALAVPRYFPPSFFRDLLRSQQEMAQHMRTLVTHQEQLFGPHGEMRLLRQDVSQIMWSLGLKNGEKKPWMES